VALDCQIGRSRCARLTGSISCRRRCWR
jgi:hypothetical protein